MNLFRSSIGRKILMAGTGFLLIVWVTGHLVGNLQIFSDADKINGYAHFLHSLGPILWIERLVLLALVAIHIWAATVLSLENKEARGVPYSVKHTIRATVTSRTMRWTGYVVLAFLVYHLAHFTLGWAQSGTFKTNLPEYTMRGEYHVAGFPVVAAGTKVLDVQSMVILGFQNPVVSLFYIIAVGLLSMHLLHGADSMFQTLGWRSGKWSGALRKVCIVFAAAYFFFNLMIPASVLLGRLQPRAEVRAELAAHR
ncbi:MAG TPA: succinate dehydrogenase cytochrome b subunit [Opitutus sp.]|nr:succinate dehydrogenase cytochrome b subunit [Opitutus sp.]